MDVSTVQRADADVWARWFRALGDPTRILLLNLLATTRRPMTVGEIVQALDVGQSTVSHHLKILGEVRFLLVDRVGATSWWRMNDRCLASFPTAAQLVLGSVPTRQPWDHAEAPVMATAPGGQAEVLADLTVRAMTSRDWPAVKAIYEAGIATGSATFETSAPAWEAWDRSHLADHRWVAVATGGEIAGWVSLSAVSDRCVYAGVAENSVYIAPAWRGRGVGRLLLETLIVRAEEAGIWTIQTGIFPENTASLRLHEACGFRIVGRRQRVGQLRGQWRDTYFLERRSTTVGIDDGGGAATS